MQRLDRITAVESARPTSRSAFGRPAGLYVVEEALEFGIDRVARLFGHDDALLVEPQAGELHLALDEAVVLHVDGFAAEQHRKALAGAGR